MNQADIKLQHYDFQEAQELMYLKEVLTQEERDFCMQVMPKMAKAYLFHNSWNNTYLNLQVYSEVEKEKFDLRREMGF
jgi:hypothetical protein